MEPTLVVSALAASVAAGLFLAAGLNLRRQEVDPAGRVALELFGLWWVGLAFYAVAGASQDMIAAFGPRPLVLFVVLRYVQMGAVCIGLWGLMYYVGYVLTGKRGLMVPLAAFYGLYYGAVLFLVTRSLPSGVEVEPWRTGLVFQNPVLGAAGVAALLVIPPLVGALTYLILYTVAREPTQRLRIILVAVATGAWSASAMTREVDWAAVLPAVLGLLSGWTISWAYSPPEWLARRLAERAEAPEI